MCDFEVIGSETNSLCYYPSRENVPTISVAGTLSVDEESSLYDAVNDIGDDRPNKVTLEVICESAASCNRKSPITVQEWVEHLPLNADNGLFGSTPPRHELDGDPYQHTSEDIVNTSRKLRFEDVEPTSRLQKDLNRNSSLNSDVSKTSRSSLEMVLESRVPDAEEVLLSLGFGGPSTAAARIPERFLRPSKLKGIDLEKFLEQEEEAGETADIGSLGYRGLSGSPSRRPSVIVERMLDLLKTERRNSAQLTARNSISRQSIDHSPFLEDRQSLYGPSLLDRFRDHNGNIRRMSSTPSYHYEPPQEEVNHQSIHGTTLDSDLLAGNVENEDGVILRRRPLASPSPTSCPPPRTGRHTEESIAYINFDGDFDHGQKPLAESSGFEPASADSPLSLPRSPEKNLSLPLLGVPQVGPLGLEDMKTPTAFQVGEKYYLVEGEPPAGSSQTPEEEYSSFYTAFSLPVRTQSDDDSLFDTPQYAKVEINIIDDSPRRNAEGVLVSQESEPLVNVASTQVHEYQKAHRKINDPSLGFNELTGDTSKDGISSGSISPYSQTLVGTVEGERSTPDPRSEIRSSDDVSMIVKWEETENLAVCNTVYSSVTRRPSQDLANGAESTQEIVKLGRLFSNSGKFLYIQEKRTPCQETVPDPVRIMRPETSTTVVTPTEIFPETSDKNGSVSEFSPFRRRTGNSDSTPDIYKRGTLEEKRSIGRGSLQRQKRVEDVNGKSEAALDTDPVGPCEDFLTSGDLSRVTKDIGTRLDLIEDRIAGEAELLSRRNKGEETTDQGENSSSCHRCADLQRATESTFSKEYISRFSAEHSALLDAVEVNRKELVCVRKLLEVIAQKLNDMSS